MIKEGKFDTRMPSVLIISPFREFEFVSDFEFRYSDFRSWMFRILSPVTVTVSPVQ